MKNHKNDFRASFGQLNRGRRGSVFFAENVPLTAVKKQLEILDPKVLVRKVTISAMPFCRFYFT